MSKTNLVNELQVSAEQDDVLTVLRKTKRLASKLGRNDIADWLKWEHDGYPDASTLPSYRRVGTSIAINSSGYIPIGYGQVSKGLHDLSYNPDITMPVPEAISTILAWTRENTDNHSICKPVPEGTEFAARLRAGMNPLIANQVSFLFKLDMCQLQAIPERIKDKVLDWACALEQAGVNGDGLTFNAKEKEIAHSVVFNISDSKIEQLTSLGTNFKGG